MTITAIILLLVLGIILLLVEFLIIPGTTIAGIGGVISLGVGVYMAYNSFGTTVGSFTLIGALLFLVASIVFALKSGTWSKLSLKSNIDSKVDTIDEQKIHIGDIGKTITRCNPIGKILVNNEQVEAKSYEGFIDQNTEIEITKIIRNQVVIKSIKK